MQNDTTMATVGFVILSHAPNPLFARLMARLNSLYDFPPIVIHHDYSQAPLDLSESELPENISFVRPHIQTKWGRFSIIDAFLAALENLYERYNPDWFSNLSTSCYPVSKGTSVRLELTNSQFDAFLGMAMIHPHMQYPSEESIRNIGEILLSPSLPTYPSDVPKWMNACYRRYVASEKTGTLFGPSFACFAGDQWFTANRRVADLLVRSKRALPDLSKHYSSVHVPDESYYQTVVGNDRDLKISTCNRRFANWHTLGAHPLTLKKSDLPELLTSNCHFARKVSGDESRELLDALDRWQDEQNS